jgi:hypothetical protein
MNQYINFCWRPFQSWLNASSRSSTTAFSLIPVFYNKRANWLMNGVCHDHDLVSAAEAVPVELIGGGRWGLFKVTVSENNHKKPEQYSLHGRCLNGFTLWILVTHPTLRTRSQYSCVFVSSVNVDLVHGISWSFWMILMLLVLPAFMSNFPPSVLPTWWLRDHLKW